jgi:hypothetical protein
MIDSGQFSVIDQCKLTHLQLSLPTRVLSPLGGNLDSYPDVTFVSPPQRAFFHESKAREQQCLLALHTPFANITIIFTRVAFHLLATLRRDTGYGDFVATNTHDMSKPPAD